MRSLVLTLFVLGALTLAPVVRASPPYPAAVQSDLGLSAMPPESCQLCHNNPNGGTGTAVQPFALSMRATGLTGGSNLAALAAGLKTLDAACTDSDRGGVADIQELRNGTNPDDAKDDLMGADAGACGMGDGGVPEGGGFVLPQVPEYGWCAMRPGANAGGAGGVTLGAGIGLIAVVRRSRRRRR
jgi:hypothetical protein